MAIIYTYPRLNNPDGTELVVVSETKNQNATRLIALSDIAALVPSSAGGTITKIKLDFNPAATTDTGLRLWDGIGWVDEITITTTGMFDVGGTLNADHGGTGQDSYLQGDMLYYDATPATLDILNIGGPGEVLTVAGGVPTWAALPSSVIDVNVGTPAVSAGSALTIAPSTGNVLVKPHWFGGGALVGYVPTAATAAATDYLKNNGTWDTPPDTNWTYSLVTPGAGTGTGIPIQLTSPDTATTSIELREGTNVTLSTTPGQITINAASPIGPTKTNYDGSLGLRGLGGGVILPASFAVNKAHYWIFGDYVYLEFYLEFTPAVVTAAGPPAGAIILTDLPPLGTIAPIGAAEEQGSCLVTRNDGLGSPSGPAPRIGRTGIHASDEVLFKTTDDSLYGVYTDALWEWIDGDYSAGNFTLAGTIQWAH